MAINKNFVIKNGVEVNTNLLVGDSTLNKVGIATTVPGYTLHIGVGGGASGYSNGSVTIQSAQQGGNDSNLAFAIITLL